MTDSDYFDDALDRLARGQPPGDLSRLNKEQRRMVQMAQAVRGGGRAEAPHPDFVENLERRLHEPSAQGIPRRTALISGLGAIAAGVAAGIGLEDAINSGSPTAGYDNQPLVGTNGHWQSVAASADLREGGVKSFTAGAVRGFIIRKRGKVRAVSGICTHMGGLLNFEPAKHGLICPLHGAEFELDGWLRRYPKGYGAKLPSLPAVQVRERAGAIEVWTI